MADFLKGLFVNPFSPIIFILGIYIAGVLSSLIYVIAFFEGRSIYFGLPSIRILPKLNQGYFEKIALSGNKKDPSPNLSPTGKEAS